MTIKPDEFEAGTNVTARVRGEKSSGLVISVRLPADDTDRLMALADETGRSISEIARQAIQSFLRGGAPAHYAFEISYGSSDDQARAGEPPRVDTPTERETFAPPVLQKVS